MRVKREGRRGLKCGGGQTGEGRRTSEGCGWAGEERETTEGWRGGGYMEGMVGKLFL